MPPTQTPLTWIQTAPEPSGVYFAECGPYNFPDMGYLLRMHQIGPKDSPILFWAMDGYRLDEAKARAERLANQHVPVILAH